MQRLASSTRVRTALQMGACNHCCLQAMSSPVSIEWLYPFVGFCLASTICRLLGSANILDSTEMPPRSTFKLLREVRTRKNTNGDFTEVRRRCGLPDENLPPGYSPFRYDGTDPSDRGPSHRALQAEAEPQQCALIFPSSAT